MRWIVFRKRDKHGRLVRHDPELPEGVEVDEDGMRVVSNPVPFARMFKQVMAGRGFEEKKADEMWREYMAENTRMGVGG